MEFKHPTVSEIVEQIKILLEGQFRNISFVGEVTNLSFSSSGHWYFTLSDNDAAISAALFKMDAMRNPQIKSLKDGDKVLVSGSVGVYSKRGTFQIIVKRITPVGKGDLKEQFELLKRKLASEGLFDIEHKKEIPAMPKRVAVITAERGAALQDFLNIVKRRSLWMDVVVIPALVQGDGASASVRAALERAIRYTMDANQKGSGRGFDVVVITRGGGSLEDLWAFNDEALAWDIYNCPIPVISAVGHQVDYSICDFVADKRMETPSAAAETLTNEQMTIKERMIAVKRELEKFSSRGLVKQKSLIYQMNPKALLDKIWNNFMSLERRLKQCDLKHRSLELTSVHEYSIELDDYIERMQNAMTKKIEVTENRLHNCDSLLRVLNPNNVLERGYSYVQSEDGKVLSDIDSFNKLPANSSISLKFKDGTGNVFKGPKS